MKKKQLTFLLIGSVSAVWGIIFYQVFSSSAGAENLPQKGSILVNVKKQNSYSLIDTFKLSLNYRDPFLEENSSDLITISALPNIQEVHLSVADVPPSEFLISSLVGYNGYITNPLNQKVISIINVSGKQQMLEEGQIIAGVKLLKNYRDSIMISYQKKTYFVSLK